MNPRQMISEAARRGSSAVWVSDKRKRMDICRGLDGFRVSFSENNIYLYGHGGLCFSEAVAIAERWLSQNR